jgi:AcrR family transcriptional regulator
MTDTGSTRDRLLLAAAELLAEPSGREVSTRAVCERAGVQAPTLYHFFGSKQGLVDAVVEQRFTEHMLAGEAAGDPVAALRASWDRHVRFGLDQPAFYVPATIIAPAEELAVDQLNQVARQGRLLVAPEVAAKQVVAATVGVTLSLLAAPDTGWSTRLRDTVLASVLTDAGTSRPAGSLPAMAVGLLAALDEDPAAFTNGERTLLREWLHRVS